VEDDDFVRSVTIQTLQSLGVENTSGAGNGREGLRLLEAGPPPFDLVICDIAMPECDGMEFMWRMAEKKFRTPVVILSGREAPILRSVELMAKQYGLTIASVLQKPLSRVALREAIKSCRSMSRGDRSIVMSQYAPDAILAALERQEFEPYFQPKIEISSGLLRGCEALARWRHRQQGILASDQFVSVVEHLERMNDLTWMMLRQAAPWWRVWRADGRTLPLNLNLSMSSLSDIHFADHLYEAVLKVGMSPEDLILEITETVAMSGVARSLESLCRLRLMGFGLSIDDFGSGFSSLEQLSKVPYTELKIGRVFVDGIACSPQKRAVVDASMHIAKEMGLQSVAEGVENADDWECLQALGCDMAQGYFLSKPLSGVEFTRWAISWRFDSLHEK
jgi:EAL domain-containing protein (putative c-di-GMP-specific phosphodiesterase class I)/CheY-like chemotaxis protein